MTFQAASDMVLVTSPTSLPRYPARFVPSLLSKTASYDVAANIRQALG
jgi:hypothetical protein